MFDNEDGESLSKSDPSEQSTDGQTSYMQLLVATSENMVTESQEFGSIQDQQSSTSVQLLMEMQTIATIVQHLAVTSLQPSLLSKFKILIMEIITFTELLSMENKLLMYWIELRMSSTTSNISLVTHGIMPPK